MEIDCVLIVPAGMDLTWWFGTAWFTFSLVFLQFVTGFLFSAFGLCWESVCSGRTELERNILNDEWVSTPPDSYVEKAAEKTWYERKLYETEDEMLALDLLVDMVTCTRQKLEPIVSSATRMTLQDAVRRMAARTSPSPSVSSFSLLPLT